jgi:hypothetical protein
MTKETEFFDGYPQSKPEECKACPNVSPDYIVGTWFCGVVTAKRSIQQVCTRNTSEIWEYHTINLDRIPKECPKNFTKEVLLSLPVQPSEN